MQRPAVTLIEATPEHFGGIVRIEREAGGGSLVVLTEGLALQEAHDRGHFMVVALDGAQVAGWVWFSVDAGRGGEEAGRIFRVAVARTHMRRGIGRTLIEHAQATLAAGRATRVRVTLAADDGDARAFLTRLGFAPDAVTLERGL